MEESTTNDGFVYALIGNIPSDYHSSDLRNFFSKFIENGNFVCFHFKHRPEGENPDKTNPDSEGLGSNVTETSNTEKRSKSRKKTCCITKLKESKYRELVQLYHRRHWIGKNGETIPLLCFISKIKLKLDDGSSKCYKTREEMREKPVGGKELSTCDLDRLQELHPPEMMPNGNVGTPTTVFLEFIKECRLPPKIIGKLGLKFPKSRNRCIYGNVKYNYGDINTRKHSSKMGQKKVISRKTEVLNDEPTGNSTATSQDPTDINNTLNLKSKEQSNVDQCKKQNNAKLQPTLGLERVSEENLQEESGEDDDDCEEWERHEALHDDPANYERNKERVYEEDLEVVWEKGGPGLVWYTDEKYWRDQKGDFDEQEADDWDVDMSIYYEPHAGDKDARDLHLMRQQKRRQRGFDDDEDIFGGKVGRFEKHTRGIGRKVLEQQGWTEGAGLGSACTGMADALDNDGQKPTDKSGFGYRGEKLPQYFPSSSVSRHARKRKDEDDFIISTKYDYMPDLEIPETSMRRVDHKTMKYRDGIHFKKSEDYQSKNK